MIVWRVRREPGGVSEPKSKRAKRKCEKPTTQPEREKGNEVTANEPVPRGTSASRPVSVRAASQAHAKPPRVWIGGEWGGARGPSVKSVGLWMALRVRPEQERRVAEGVVAWTCGRRDGEIPEDDDADDDLAAGIWRAGQSRPRWYTRQPDQMLGRQHVSLFFFGHLIFLSAASGARQVGQFPGPPFPGGQGSPCA